jgi:hypothetical protein
VGRGDICMVMSSFFQLKIPWKLELNYTFIIDLKIITRSLLEEYLVTSGFVQFNSTSPHHICGHLHIP